MTLITMTGDKVMMKDGAVRTESACCCASGALCTYEMCVDSGYLCTTGAGSFRYVFVTFDMNLTSPCFSPSSPIDANGDCNTVVANGFHQIYFGCATGSNSNNVLALFYYEPAQGYINAMGGLYEGYYVNSLRCENKRLVMRFFIPRGTTCFGQSVASSPDQALVNAYGDIDFGPMPADCNDIDGLTASGFVFRRTGELWLGEPPGVEGFFGWVSAYENCGYDLPQAAKDMACPDSYIPFTATLSTAINNRFASNVGCA